MNFTVIVSAGVLLVGLALLATVILRRRPRSLKIDYFQQRWKELQTMCRSNESWAGAIVGADQLLDEALKKRRLGGKTMGERMVRAQRLFTDNDGAWFGHKLRSKVESEPDMKLKEDEVKNALIGIRQALKDLGALPK